MVDESLVTITVQFSGADQELTQQIAEKITEEVKSKTKNLNLISHIDIKNMPLIVKSNILEEVPSDIKSYLVKENE